MTATGDSKHEVLLSHGDHEALVSSLGASLRGFWRLAPSGEPQEIVTPYAGAAVPDSARAPQLFHRSLEQQGKKLGGQGDVLIPFPGRISYGRYQFEGRAFQMQQNDKETPSAIHGFLRTLEWDCTRRTSESVEFKVRIDAAAYEERGYPFSLTTTVHYHLDELGLTCRLTIENSGNDNAPVAAGFHPYLSVGSGLIDEDELRLPMDNYLEMVNLIPTGRILPVEGSPLDFRRPRRIGDTVFNQCFVNPQRDADGLLKVQLSRPGGRSVTVWMDRTFNYVVLYSGDPLPEGVRRRSLAIEPMTCGSDAFNHPEWGLVTLRPGQKLDGEWGVQSN